jgi:uncharacterized protein YfaS (alpha-2-macroglobulin family)
LHYTVSFRGPFPESSAFRVEAPADVKDDGGRTPANARMFPLTVKTGQFPPLAKFSGVFGVLERAHPVLPVTVRRLEPEMRTLLLRADSDPSARSLLDRIRGAIFRIPPEYGDQMLPWLRRLAAADRERSIFSGEQVRTAEVTLPRREGADAFEVVGLPLDKPGLYVVELQSQRLGAALLGKPAPMYVPAAALVTNLAVHLKWGAEQSLVWVTRLSDARGVSGARVTVHDCEGTVLWRGRTEEGGLARIPGLPAPGAARDCPTPKNADAYSRVLGALYGGLFVVAQTVDDLSFVHSSWKDGIEPWRFGLSEGGAESPFGVHTILDRSLLRAGETVHMKHVARVQTLGGFSLPPAGELPRAVSIRHEGSEQKVDLPLTWDARAGVAETEWKIPRDARLGNYEIVMLGGPAVSRWQDGEAERSSGRFQVEEFRIPLLRAVVKPPSAPQVAVSEMAVDVGVHYLAGGAARRLPVTLRTQILPRGFSGPPGFERFGFASAPVKEGITRRGVEDEQEDDGGPRPSTAPAVHHRADLVLDDAGTARAVIPRLPSVDTPRDVLAELEFRDAAGETQTVATRIPLWPAARLAGIKVDQSFVVGSTLGAQVAAVDVTGRPQKGVTVRVDAFERRLYSHRKRLVGGFYAYEHTEEIKRVGELCRGQTGPSGVFLCEGQAPAKGHLLLQASVTDDAGRSSTARADAWVVDADDVRWWYDVRDSDRIDVLPEVRRYEPGQTARLQVRSPFARATALVTVEREGVIDAWVVPISGKDPVVEVPVKPSYAPNVYISVLAVRGRIGDVKPTALVDLGRPAFKLGIAELQVGWRAHELKVTVSPGREVYRVRERVTARIAVRTPDGGAPPPGTEVAVSVVDEGLLELSPNRSWDVLEAMMRRRGEDVETATMQGHVVGKRHFGLKALPTGGGGGRQTTRELFDTLVYWKARVPVDAGGDATVEFPLNDSLTGFKIVAVALGGAGSFGTGGASIRSSQDLMVLPGIAPLVREGDRFRAEVTVRNTTARRMDVVARAQVDGLPGALPPRSTVLPPGEATVLGWDVVAPTGVSRLQWRIEVAETGGAQADHVSIAQRVVPTVPVRTYQATILQWPGGTTPVRAPVQRPSDAVPGRGGVRVEMRPTLLAGLEAVREWMRKYPYGCLEQKVSRTVALRDPAAWEALTAEFPSHLDSDGLLKYFPTMTWGSEVLTAYVLSISHAAGWSVPERDRMTAALRNFVTGKLDRRSAIASPDLILRKLAAIEALARHGAADAALLSSIRIEPNLWPTSAVLDWWSILHRLRTAPNRAVRLQEAERIALARLNLQGTVLTFSTESADHQWWLMRSADTNAVRLLDHVVETGVWTADVPRLVRGALGRQRRGAWDLTTANAWGVLALERFSRRFESTPVAGTSSATLAGATRRVEWAASPRGNTLAFPWPPQSDEVVLSHEGQGQPWMTILADAAIPLTTPLSSGFKITRTLTPIQQKQAGRWSRGDLARIRLEVEAQSDMTWVVVDDPVPAGASHLGRGLQRESTIATGGERSTGAAWPAYQERSFEAFRAYYEVVPRGTFSVEYTLRLNEAGRFTLPATRVEALYAPEMFGELPNAPIEVLE